MADNVVGKIVYDVQANTKNAEKNLKSAKASFKSISDEAKKVDNAVANSSKNVANSLSKVDKEAKKVHASFLQMNVSTKGLGNLGNASLRLTKQVLQLGTVIAGTAIAFETFIIKTATDFESSFAGVRKTVEATEEEFAKLRSELIELSKQKPVDVNQLAKIEELGGQLGIAKENLTSFTDTISDIVVTTDLMAESASKDFARIFNITREQQKNFDRFGSTIVDLGNNFATTESEIVEMTNRLAPTASLLDISTANTAGLAAALSSLGIPSELGGTAFQRLGQSIFSATQKGGADLERFAQVAGMTAEQFKQAFEEDAAKAISVFLEGIGKMKDEGGNVISVLEALNLSDVRLSRTVLALASNTDLLNNALDTSSKAWNENTALQTEAGKRYATTASQLEILKNKILSISIEIGDRLLPHVNEKIQEFTDFLNENSDEIQTLIDDVTRFGEALIDGVGIGAEKAIEALRYLRDNADELGNTLKSGALALGLINVIGLIEKLRLAIAGGGGLSVAFIALATAIGLVTKSYLDLKTLQNDLIEQSKEYAKRNLELAESYDKLAEQSEGATKTLNLTLSEQNKTQEELNNLIAKRQQLLSDRSWAEVAEDNFGAVQTYREREIEQIDKQIEQLKREEAAYQHKAEEVGKAAALEQESNKAILRNQSDLARRQIELGDEVFQQRKKFIESLNVDNTKLNESIFDGEVEINNERKKLINELGVTNAKFLSRTQDLNAKTVDARIKIAKEYNITSQKLIVDLVNINKNASEEEVKERAKSFQEQQVLAVDFYAKLAELRVSLLAAPSIDGLKQFAKDAKTLLNEYKANVEKINTDANEAIKSINGVSKSEQDNLAAQFEESERLRQEAEEAEKQRAEDLQDAFDKAQSNVVSSIKTFVRENTAAQNKAREDIKKTKEEIEELAKAYQLEELQARLEFQAEAADIVVEAEKKILEIENQIREERNKDKSIDGQIDKLNEYLKEAKDGLSDLEDQLNEATSNVEDAISFFAKNITSEIGDVNDELEKTITGIDDLINTFNEKTLSDRLSFEEDATKTVLDALNKIDELQKQINEGKNDVNVSPQDLAELQKQLDEQLAIVQYNTDQQIVSAEDLAAAQEELMMSPLELLQKRYEEEQKAREENFEKELKSLEEQKAAYEEQLVALEKEQSDFYDHLVDMGDDYVKIYDDQIKQRRRIDIQGIDDLLNEQKRVDAERLDQVREVTKIERELRRAETEKQKQESQERIDDLNKQLEEELRIVRQNESENIVSAENIAAARVRADQTSLESLVSRYEQEKVVRQENYSDELDKLNNTVKENEDSLVQLKKDNETYYAILTKLGSEFTETYKNELLDREQEFAQSLLRQIKAYKNAQGLLQNEASSNKFLSGFSSGGFTGGNVAQVAGLVHGGEYVAPAWMVNSIRPLFESIEAMRSKGYSQGGNVTTDNSRVVHQTNHNHIHSNTSLRALVQEMSIIIGR